MLLHEVNRAAVPGLVIDGRSSRVAKQYTTVHATVLACHVAPVLAGVLLHSCWCQRFAEAIVAD